MKAARWTKRDLKSLRGALDHWWTGMRRHARPGATVESVFASMPDGERARIVAAHFAGFAISLGERAAKNEETAEHALTSGVWGASTNEMHERFTRLARDDRAAALAAVAISGRVAREGLPLELADYVPEH